MKRIFERRREEINAKMVAKSQSYSHSHAKMPVNAARTLSIALSSRTPKCPSPVNHVTDLWTKLRASNLAHEASRSTFESRVPDSGPAVSDPAESLAESLAYEEYTVR